MSTYAIFAYASLIVMAAAPLLLIIAMKKIHNDEVPTIEAGLLILGGIIIWFWLINAFSYLPGS
ncbi:hypothetical protein MmiHf6_12580 [Methanimicrococcus hongohii]|uniref:Uncharacterized protein n=1 Tax=Methanimicrococcus hongohii TaxID=3028295 RepID=A0AA96V058_9EURY|nr:hypothetical protein [Methanimicrococcus sp. Hf6]WNY23934.1 hypothetical protein MmiHf6_12580 [Methanimicrococcus sp. Hf6]